MKTEPSKWYNYGQNSLDTAVHFCLNMLCKLWWVRKGLLTTTALLYHVDTTHDSLFVCSTEHSPFIVAPKGVSGETMILLTTSTQTI